MLTTNASTATLHQQYLGQLAQYDALLGHLRDAKASDIALAGIYLSLRPHSPFAQEHDVGQTHLHSLLGHPDYLARSGQLKLMNFLSVSTAEGRSVYESADQHGKEVILSMTENPGWRELTKKIERIALSIGGQLRSDKLLSLPQVLTYYGLPAAQPQSAAEMDSIIRELEERRASHSLQLCSGVDVDALNRAPTAKDRKPLNSIKRVFPTSSMNMDGLIAQLTNRNIVVIVKSFLPETENSLFSYLAKDTLASATYAQVRATPTVMLEKILRSVESERLATALLEGLNWYGGKSGEETSSGVRIKLVSKAIRLWSNNDGKPLDIVGYPWHKRSNWGKSYPSIQAEFEQHLFDSGRASSLAEAILLARLLKAEFPREFQVLDIPSDLPYRSSVVWVNFVHGVTLIEAMEPDKIERMTFQQLVDFPLRQSMEASPQELELIALCRIPPTLEWAISNGVIDERAASDYSPEEVSSAIKALDEHTAALKKAIIQLGVNHPERSTIGEREMKTYFKGTLLKDHFGKYRRAFGLNQTYFAFISDGRKLIEDFGSDNGGGVIQTPSLKDKIYSFRDVYMSGSLRKKWFITLTDGIRKSEYRINLNSDRTIETNAPWLPATLTEKPLPDVNVLFESELKNHLEQTKNAYQTLLESQLTSLPYDDRQAIEQGEIKIYTLRKSTSGIKQEDETPQMTLPLRLRMGFILQITHHAQVIYYECLPRAGIIRKRMDFSLDMIGGRRQAENIEKTILSYSETIAVLRGKRIPFDWVAHETGSLPKTNATCNAIIDQFGKTFTTPSVGIESWHPACPAVTSSRAKELANYIARNFFYFDEKLLHAAAKGETELERIAARPHWLESAKAFIPFWGSISDLVSDNPNKGWAVFGLIIDVASFAFPLGKFVSGSMKLVSTAVRSGVRASLPKFGVLSQKLVASFTTNLIPFYGVPKLTLQLSKGALGGIYTGVKFTASKSFNSLKPLLGRSGKYSFIEGLPQATHPGRWTPHLQGDQLATLRGLEDIPVRNIAPTGKASYRLIDPLSYKPYGPSLATRSGELSLGRSHYSTLAKDDRHVIVELSANSRIREVLEVDGRTTLFIDDQPYRLKDDVLRRPDLTDADNNYKAMPCRVRRAPGANLCKTSYVIRDPAPTPDLGSFVNDKGWAPWFGDIIYTPATGRAAMQVNAIRAHATLEATMEFQKGIYGRVFVSVPVRGKQLVDNFQVGSIIVEAMDGSKHYVFMRLNAGDFYVAERRIGQSVHDTLTFKKADTLPEGLKNELLLVYTGSLNANNMARIYGVGPVERALRTMDEIAIPIGGHVNPPDTLNLLKVDTSPGEAVLFDHSTRMIVRRSTDGAATWSLSKTAPDSVRETTAEIFNHLFQKEVVTIGSSTQGGPKALKIDDTMRQLQRLISQKTGRPVHNPRNIAFAEIKTKAGVHEVYVSVSGNKNDTGFLPLFAKNRSANEVKVGNASYFNIDHGIRFPETALGVTPQGKLQAIPHTINDIENYTPALTTRPTSLDTESKLISVIRDKYPDPKALDSITIATTMAPCNSCSVVMKQFAYDGPDALDVIWK